MTLSWISRRNGDSVEPPWVDLIFDCRSASERRIRKISPTQLEIVVTVSCPGYVAHELSGFLGLRREAIDDGRARRAVRKRPIGKVKHEWRTKPARGFSCALIRLILLNCPFVM